MWCARKYLDDELFSDAASDVDLETFKNADRSTDTKDPTTRLLQWAHLKAYEHIYKASVNPAFVQVQQYYDLALDRTDLRVVFDEDADLAGDGSWQDLGEAVIREEKWNKIALLVIDLFHDDDDSGSLADEVSNRVAARETDLLGKVPPWGLRCLDHAIHIELTAMRARQTPLTGDIHDILREAYGKLSHFRRSDFSILCSTSDIAGPAWASDLWGLDFIIVCCSLLSIILINNPKGKRSSD